MNGADDRAIAIVGIGCRFPGGVGNLDQFAAMLREGRDAIGDIPADRIDLERFYDPTPQTPGRMASRYGGYLADIDQFDPEFFGLSPREAERMDPQQRLMLETTWEALENAGVDQTTLDGARVGVFVGQWVSDFEQRLFQHPDEVDFPMTLGSGRYALSGRISYLFGFMGPSMTIDTACSSSLVAVHLAMQSLRSRESDLALAGGVNIILGPHIHIAYSQAGMMAPDGRCKFGDARADGYVRSEGAGVVALKRLADALREGDRIHAVIRGSAVNSDGGSSGSMGRPSVEGQKAAIRAALADAGVDPLQIAYVEAHGTGTPAGDRVEIGALASVLGEGRAADAPLLVGSVKTNIGHAESAAGVAGLIKAALAVRDGEIPASLNFVTPSAIVPWSAAPVTVAARATSWPREGPRLASINGFGISGANAHVIIEGPPAAKTKTDADRLPHLPVLTLSARSDSALRELAARVATRLDAADVGALHDLVRFSQVRRTGLSHRAAFLADDALSLRSALQAFAAGGAALAEGLADPRRPAKSALVFPGQGGQWVGMARELMATDPGFRASLQRADAVILAEAGWSLVDQLALSPDQPGYLGDRIDVVQPMLGAVCMAYADWVKDQGLAVDAVVGHSMGEAAAAYAAGALSFESALLVLCRRSARMREKSGLGAMALVDLPAAETVAALAGLEASVSVAAVNSPRATIISGDKDAVAGLVARFGERGVFSRPVNVDVASHSPQMEAPAQALRDDLYGLPHFDTTTPFVSALLGRLATGDELDANYWGRNLREPVQFAQALSVLADRGVTAFLEVGPHPVLAPSIEQALPASSVTVVGCGRRDEAERPQLLAALAKLWCVGVHVDFARTEPAPVVDFPLYPWARRRLWVETADLARATGTGAARRAPDAEAREWMYQTVWREADPGAPSKPTAVGWLLLGAADALSRSLAEAGASVDTAPLGDLERRLSQPPPGPLNVLIAAPPGAQAGFLPLRAVQAMKQDSTARLWFVTHGAQSPDGAERLDVDQASLWGAARVLANERPEAWGGLLDFPIGGPDPVSARKAAQWLLDPRNEDQAAVRGDRVLVPRITPLTDPGAARKTWRTDASYLLTGGLGGVGAAVARSMVQEGARRLILMSRSGLPPRTQWRDVDPRSDLGRRVSLVRELEALGVSVHCPAVDVSDESAVRAFLAAYAAEGWPSIRGVIHLAGDLEKALIDTVSPAQFETALAGKLRGAQIFDRLLPDLDCFVLFSSSTTFIPQPGVAAYVAANCGLEALAMDRRARGAEAVAIAWGQWRTGMLSGEAGQMIMDDQARLGVGSFSGERGAGLLSWAAARPDAVVAVAPIDWAAYARAGAARTEPLLQEMTQGLRPGLADDAEDRLTPASIFAIVRESVARTLQFTVDEVEPTRAFGTMGLTSVLAMELRNRLERALGRPLSATLAWNYPTVSALSDHLAGADAAQPAAPPAQAAETRVSDLGASVAALSELSDADALLALRRGRKASSI